MEIQLHEIKQDTFFEKERLQKMKYDFTTIMDRSGKDAIAVDVIPYENINLSSLQRRKLWGRKIFCCNGE